MYPLSDEPLFDCQNCEIVFPGWTLLDLAEKQGASESELSDLRRNKACTVKSGPHIFCLKCGGLYAKWLNYKG